MKKIILLMSFIVLTTIAHAITYTSMTRCTNGTWSKKFQIKTISNSTFGKLVLWGSIF